MTDKKILDAEQKKIVDEVLSDDELDKVAGGSGTGHKLIGNPFDPFSGRPPQGDGSTGH